MQSALTVIQKLLYRLICIAVVHIMLLPSQKSSSSYSHFKNCLRYQSVTPPFESLVVYPLLRLILDPPLTLKGMILRRLGLKTGQ